MLRNLVKLPGAVPSGKEHVCNPFNIVLFTGKFIYKWTIVHSSVSLLEGKPNDIIHSPAPNSNTVTLLRYRRHHALRKANIQMATISSSQIKTLTSSISASDKHTVACIYIYICVYIYIYVYIYIFIYHCKTMMFSAQRWNFTSRPAPRTWKFNLWSILFYCELTCT